MRLEAILANGIRLVITKRSDGRNVSMLNDVATHRREEIEFKQV